MLYDNISQNMHVLNKTALAVWNLCDVEESPQGIAHRLAAKYNIPEKQVLPEVLNCLNRLEELGLIKRVGL